MLPRAHHVRGFSYLRFGKLALGILCRTYRVDEDAAKSHPLFAELDGQWLARLLLLRACLLKACRSLGASSVSASKSLGPSQRARATSFQLPQRC
jgi:hypothetical protein